MNRLSQPFVVESFRDWKCINAFVNTHTVGHLKVFSLWNSWENFCLSGCCLLPLMSSPGIVATNLCWQPRCLSTVNLKYVYNIRQINMKILQFFFHLITETAYGILSTWWPGIYRWFSLFNRRILWNVIQFWSQILNWRIYCSIIFFAEPVKHISHPTAYVIGQLNHLAVKKRSDLMDPGHKYNVWRRSRQKVKQSSGLLYQD